MDFTFSIGLWAVIVLIVASVAIGALVQFIGEAHFPYEWALTALGAGIGGFAASEFITSVRDWQPVFDGLALVPALIGGVLVGLVVAAATRFLTTGQHGAPRAI